MDMKLTARDVMHDAPVIPVIVLADAAHAVPLARALVAGGIRMLEVTLRTNAALAAIEAIAREVPDAVVGAGTVRSATDADAAARAGAKFFVSPGYTSSLGRACRELGLPYLPGVATSSEIMAAQDDGWHALKFFPALPAGGTAMLKAWQGPFGDVLFCPTGGLRPLKRNLGRSVIKTSAVPDDRHVIEAPARIFDSQDDLQKAFKAG